MVNETMQSLHLGPAIAQYLLWQMEEAIVLNAELADTGQAITLLETGGQDLLDLEAALNKNLSDLGYK